MYKPSTYLVGANFPTYLPIYETYFLQNWLPRLNHILTQLRFNHNRHLMDGVLVGAGSLWPTLHVVILKTTRFVMGSVLSKQVIWAKRTMNPQPHKSISSHAQYVILQRIIVWRNVKTCGFGSGKWFWLNIHCRVLLWLVKGATMLCTLQKTQCNRYDLTSSQCLFYWPMIMIHPSGLLLVLPPPICCTSFSFMGGVAKK